MGKVTIVNVLISSKIWYYLRTFRPTQAFFSSLRSIIYQFVWQKKSPPLAKDLVFASWEKGGLQVLDPQVQHKVLQKRWLNYILQPLESPSFIYPLLVAHLSLMANANAFPLLPFYYPAARSGPHVARTLSIWPIIFETYDILISSHSDSLQLTDIPVTTILQLPLHMILQNQPPAHWSYRHPQFLASHFLLFDIQHQRLRLKVPGEYTRYPRLCQDLFRQILTHRSILLKSFVWPHVIYPPRPSPYDWSHHTLIQQLTHVPAFASFSSKSFRSLLARPLLSHHHFPSPIIKIFWSCMMYPQARTVFYRALTKRIPHNAYRFSYGAISSPTCTICHQDDEDRLHFLTSCPRKWILWDYLLHLHYPTTTFTPEIIYATLLELTIPITILDIPRFLTICSTILWQIWIAHWQHGSTNGQPLSLLLVSQLKPRIASKIRVLLPR
jgi:hypothetical protein